MRTTFRGCLTTLFAALPLALPAALSAQSTPILRACSSGIGKPIAYTVEGGRPALPFLFFTSLQRGSIPLAIVDPGDTRSLGIGLDLLFLTASASFDAGGKIAFSIPLPNDASLAGQAALHQVLEYPGTGRLFGPMSEVAVVPFEPAGAWRGYPLNVMNDDRAWVGHIPLADGKILACGGGRGAILALQAWDSTSVYDPATRTFAVGPKMTQTRGVHTTSALPDGRYLLTGGVDAINNPQDTCDYYDPKTNAFSNAPMMSVKRTIHTATTLKDGRVLVAGGLQDLNGQLQAITSATPTTEIFDPVTAKWSAGPVFSEPKAGHTAHLLPDGRVLFLGGITWTTLIIKIPAFTARVEVFDPVTNKITRLADMPTARAGHSSAVLADGRVIVAGGAGGSVLTGGAVLDNVELFDVANNAWSAGKPLRSKKALMGAVLLHDGRFALVGGSQGTLLNALPIIAECDLWDPTTGNWSVLPSLNTPRATHLAIELPSCAILALGGASTASTLRDHELLYR